MNHRAIPISSSIQRFLLSLLPVLVLLVFQSSPVQAQVDDPPLEAPTPPTVIPPIDPVKNGTAIDNGLAPERPNDQTQVQARTAVNIVQELSRRTMLATMSAIGTALLLLVLLWVASRWWIGHGWLQILVAVTIPIVVFFVVLVLLVRPIVLSDCPESLEEGGRAKISCLTNELLAVAQGSAWATPEMKSALAKVSHLQATRSILGAMDTIWAIIAFAGVPLLVVGAYVSSRKDLSRN